MTKEERIYKRIIKIFPDIQMMQVGDCRAIENKPFMPLSLDVIDDFSLGLIIAMSHHALDAASGDLMCDPDMQILINFELGTATPMSYQNDWLGIYQESLFFGEDGQLLYRQELMRDLTILLDMWTQDLLDQGFVEACASQEAMHVE